jgi:phage baseplate assembly protein W
MQNSDFLGRGFAFPLGVDPVTGRMKMAEYEEDIRQAIYIILMTRKGERAMRPEFGCDIHDYAFGSMDYETLSLVEQAVTESLVLWEPRIRDIEVHAYAADAGRLNIEISYVVRSTNNPYNLVYPFYISEGMKAAEE